MKTEVPALLLVHAGILYAQPPCQGFHRLTAGGPACVQLSFQEKSLFSQSSMQAFEDKIIWCHLEFGVLSFIWRVSGLLVLGVVFLHLRPPRTMTCPCFSQSLISSCSSGPWSPSSFFVYLGGLCAYGDPSSRFPPPQLPVSFPFSLP